MSLTSYLVELPILGKLTWDAMRDPIYDYIDYNKDIEAKIIDTPVFQRLRRIKQLQLSYLVYPGAEHTRFQHSIGVMYLAGVFSSHITTQLVRKLGGHDIDGYKADVLVESSRIAGLLHDLGHGPFSHAFEEIILSNKSLRTKGLDDHEKLGLLLIEYTEISKILQDAEEKGLDNISDVLRKLLAVEEPKEPILRLYRKIVKAWVYPADIMDFLMRDSYYTGTREYGSIDYQRLIRGSYPAETGSVYEHIALDTKCLGALRSYLNNRTQMYENVYFHPVTRAFNRLLSEVLREVDEYLGLTEAVERLSEGDPSAYIKLSDEYVYAKLLDLKDQRDLSSDLREKIKMLLYRKNPWKRIGADHKIPLIALGGRLDPAILAFRYMKKWVKDLEQHVRSKISAKLGNRVNEEDIWVDSNTLHPAPLSSLVEPHVFYVAHMRGGEIVDVKPYSIISFMVNEGIIPRIIVRAYASRTAIRDKELFRELGRIVDEAINEFFNISTLAGGITL